MSSLGLTITATSPKTVSGLVVETVMNEVESLIGYLKENILLFLFSEITSKSDIAVLSFVSQFIRVFS